MQLQQTNVELENSRETLRQESDRTSRILGELEVSKKEVVTAQEEARVAQEMVEELISQQGDKSGAGADDQLAGEPSLPGSLRHGQDHIECVATIRHRRLLQVP